MTVVHSDENFASQVRTVPFVSCSGSVPGAEERGDVARAGCPLLLSPRLRSPVPTTCSKLGSPPPTPVKCGPRLDAAPARNESITPD